MTTVDELRAALSDLEGSLAVELRVRVGGCDEAAFRAPVVGVSVADRGDGEPPAALIDADMVFDDIRLHVLDEIQGNLDFETYRFEAGLRTHW